MQIALLILLFFTGLVGRRLGWLTPRHGARVFNLVMTIGLPALFLANISRLHLTRELLWLPGLAVAIMLATWGIATLLGRALGLSRQTLGAFVIGAMGINVAFEFPFVIAAWGEAAFAQLAVFDLGNALMQCTLMYGLAARYGGHGTSVSVLFKRVATFPPLVALVVALALKFAGVGLPAPLLDILSWLGRFILLGVIVALGVLFDARHIRSPAIVCVIALRIVGGLLLGYLFVGLLGLQGDVRAVVLLAAASPIGFNAVVMANRESLDREFAASAASLSVMLALAYVPLVLLLHKLG